MQSYELHFSTFPATSAVPHCTHLTEVSTRKRVGRACDACRIKKTKCGGSKPCSRCIAEDKICVFTDRKRSTDKLYVGSYVELLESRIKMLQQGIELLLQRINRGDSITSLLDDQGKISINKVLETLAVKFAETDAMSGSKRASWSSAIATSASMIDEDDIEKTGSTADYSTKRRRGSEGELATHSEPQSSPLEAEEYSLDNVRSCTHAVRQDYGKLFDHHTVLFEDSRKKSLSGNQSQLRSKFKHNLSSTENGFAIFDHHLAGGRYRGGPSYIDAVTRIRKRSSAGDSSL